MTPSPIHKPGLLRVPELCIQEWVVKSTGPTSATGSARPEKWFPSIAAKYDGHSLWRLIAHHGNKQVGDAGRAHVRPVR